MRYLFLILLTAQPAWACVGDEGSCYSVSLTASEMQAAAVQVNIIDAAPKAYLDKCLIIRTQD